MSWTVVRFLGEDSVEAVPTSWVLGNSCYWPTLTKEKVIAAIRKQEEPNTCWPLHPVSFFRNGTFDSYLDARKHSKIAEYESDLNEDKESRSVRRKKIVSSSSSSEEEPKISDPPKRNLSNSQQFIKGNKNTDALSKSVTVMDNNDNSISLSSEGQIRDATSKNHRGRIQHTDDDATNSPITDSCICCPIHKKEMEKLNTLICSLQSTISENIKILIRKQSILTNIVTDAVGEIRTISEGIQTIKIAEIQSGYGESVFNKFPFPIDTMEKFQEAEHFWSEESNFKASVHEFSKIGGNSVYDFVKRVMTLILTNNLASSFTWFGTKSKDSLVNSKLAEVLLSAADNSSISCDKKIVEEAARKYLRRAKERSVSEKRHLDP